MCAAAATGAVSAWTAATLPPPAGPAGGPVDVAGALFSGSLAASVPRATTTSPATAAPPPSAPTGLLLPGPLAGARPPAPVSADGTHPCTADDALAGAQNRHAGQTLDEVRAALGAAARLRVIGQDGRCLPLTRDYVPGRTNVYLEDGVVVRSSTG
ncbi:MAG TPA: hypothetical protein VFY17_01945 [Pilimelia sp.]|nr:hypothetical protein [Pilimelia sp.]